jgi:hypothetical protein
VNILLINHYTGSPQHGMEYRAYYLAREWVGLGHKVQIVASAYSHVRAQQPQLTGQDRLDETIDVILYTWFKAPAYSALGGSLQFIKVSVVSAVFATFNQLKEFALSHQCALL